MKTETISKVSTALDEYLSDEEKKALTKKAKAGSKKCIISSNPLVEVVDRQLILEDGRVLLND